MKSRVKRVLSGSIFLTVMSISLVMTGYIFASSFETVTHIDLDYIDTLSSFSGSHAVDSVLEQFEDDLESDYSKEFEPRRLVITSLNTRLELQPVISDNSGAYLVQKSKGHFIVLNEQPESSIGDLVVMLNLNWRTIPNIEDISKSDLIKIQLGEDLVNTYKVIMISTTTSDQPPLFKTTDLASLILVGRDPTTDTRVFIQAQFIAQE